MKLCFPIASDKGVQSTLYGHFASAPLFFIYDTVSATGTSVGNCDEKNPYAGCNPFMALRGLQLDGIVVAGIGDEALRTMNLCGYRVFQAQSELVADSITLLEGKKLDELVVMDSHLEGRCTNDDGTPRTCNHNHDHDHDDHDLEDCDPSACDPSTCTNGSCDQVRRQ